ncbi:lactonase family protein [Heyndrickxia ginsengihumi]|uniref:Lactonase family protein n=1 Tax=Heyndrickxia ginsengihumi TaxID=363870 RepID=A0A6M0P6K2_9BACI|nr:lactonase family protein [Heyndrickxia ginsengihumi]NEY19905.1 lactonase family protein [Heyndrickxia ginsengihumi]
MSHSKLTGFVGTYTKAESKGIYSFTLDTEKKRLCDVKLAATLDNPTYVTVSSDQQNLYAVVKEGDKGGVAAFSLDAGTGSLHELNRQVTPGASPCHVSVDQNKQIVVTANYHKGTVESYLTKKDGSVQPAVAIIEHTGSGLIKERQEKPHVHFAGFTPDEKYICAVDLGTDTLTTYELKDDQLNRVNELKVRPGSGPRHLAFHPNRNFAYLMTELSNEVIALQFDESTGSFKDLQYILTIPESFNDNNQGSAIHLSSDGRFLYAANRGHDSIALFSINQDSGELTFVEHTSTEGAWPRDFVLDPTENFLVASNQNSNNLVLYARDAKSGKLTLLQSNIAVPEPVCVKFIGI